MKALLGLIQPPPPPTAAAAAAAAAAVPSVKPGRPARALIARIIILVLTRGDQKSLYDVVQSLLKGVNGSETKGAPEREKEWRIACTFVLGEVYAVFGSQVRSRRTVPRSGWKADRVTAQVMSLYIDIVTTTTRIFRSTSYVSLLCARPLPAVN